MSSVNIRKLVEFKIGRDKLVEALRHISNISNHAGIGIIVNRYNPGQITGIVLYGLLEKQTGHLYSKYPILNSEMECLPKYFTENAKEWPDYYIDCSENFRNSILTLPAIDSSKENNARVIDVVLCDVKDENTRKSMSIVSSSSEAKIQSIIDHPGLNANYYKEVKEDMNYI